MKVKYLTDAEVKQVEDLAKDNPKLFEHLAKDLGWQVGNEWSKFMLGLGLLIAGGHVIAFKLKKK